ncbi:Polypeptide-transport-associated domain protein FtsQ-type [Beutenbergia cavernae DSM 12333]|uniref:Polypeptide-transport-associated domain protein FtsQ-type n=1 Tax=Beutenbergia cavernae (strain ATCC BAA-8 / DSM 12333 / CCUG 43141 / JCM 11478 / NBRC 16432 / NCIMB 13614 / HKI 0122) TaxID=471853 RepID=C5BW57_BEUC1|nr:cell division protein FtsQ/DivIB [Beutenbergia cavernae]ACQ80658.1 Polypeptide-transport-associated domain protein FtsQ-type [Beutenbergia cavernae DSM 12333]
MRPPAAPRRPERTAPPERDTLPQRDAPSEHDAPAEQTHDAQPAVPPREPPSADADRAEEAPAESRLVRVAPRESSAPAAFGPPRVSQISDRLAERESARRRRTGLRLGVLAGVVAVLAGLGWLVLASPVLALRDDAVEVVGAGGYVDGAAVAAVAGPEVGVPLARIDLAALAEEIEQIPAVQDAGVSRSWPGGLRIEITPRTPVAVVPGDEGTLLLDAEGVVIATVPAGGETPAGLPEMTVPLDDGARQDAVAAVLEVLGALPDELRAQIVTAGARSEQSVRFELADGARVEWGSPAESALKVAVLSTLLQVGAAYYDVSAPEAPITR